MVKTSVVHRARCKMSKNKRFNMRDAMSILRSHDPLTNIRKSNDLHPQRLRHICRWLHVNVSIEVIDVPDVLVVWARLRRFASQVRVDE